MVHFSVRDRVEVEVRMDDRIRFRVRVTFGLM